MCYFLYGAINEGVNTDDCEKITKGTGYHFALGNVDSVNEGVANCDDTYRITSNHCDCDTAIGQKAIGKKELEKFRELLLDLQNVRGIKYLLISKNWWEETNSKQQRSVMNIFFIYFSMLSVSRETKVNKNENKKLRKLFAPLRKKQPSFIVHSS